MSQNIAEVTDKISRIRVLPTAGGRWLSSIRRSAEIIIEQIRTVRKWRLQDEGEGRNVDGHAGRTECSGLSAVISCASVDGQPVVESTMAIAPETDSAPSSSARSPDPRLGCKRKEQVDVVVFEIATFQRGKYRNGSRHKSRIAKDPGNPHAAAQFCCKCQLNWTRTR